MTTPARQVPRREAAPLPSKVEDNTLDEQHAGIPERTFPATDNDQRPDSGQSHVANAPRADRQRRIAVAAYLRAQRRGFVPGAELDDWATMEKTGRVGIGSFVMRGHEYLVAIIADNGVLRADTLRYADEIRTPETIGLAKRSKATASKVTQFTKVIADLTRSDLDLSELQDEEAQALEKLAETKQKEDDDVIHRRGLEQVDAETGSAQVIDLMAVLRKSLSKSAVVKTASDSAPISLDERRTQRAAKTATPPKRKPRKSSTKRKAAR